MHKTITGLLGAAAALGALGAAQASTAPDPTAEALKANSFAELLEPIPNASALLKVVDESQANAATEANVQVAYHHHHHSWRRYRHHHHHHHHHYRR